MLLHEALKEFCGKLTRCQFISGGTAAKALTDLGFSQTVVGLFWMAYAGIEAQEHLSESRDYESYVERCLDDGEEVRPRQDNYYDMEDKTVEFIEYVNAYVEKD